MTDLIRISELDAVTSVESDELIPMTADPSTAPKTVKTTFDEFIGSQFSAKGQIRVATGNNTSANLTVGNDAQKLVCSSGSAGGGVVGLDWVDDQVGFNIIIGSGLAVPTAGSGATAVMGYMEIPFNMTLESVTIIGDTSGSCSVDVWKDTYANFPPTDADSITGGVLVALAGAQKAQTVISGWTVTWTKGDWLGFNLDTCSTIKQLTIGIKGKRRLP